jgi:hypothetical protein
MPSQSEMTKPSKPILCFSTSVMSSRWACIFSGSPTPSSVQSTLEKEGMTDPTRYLRTADTYGARSIRANSRRLATVTPWSMV